MLFRYMGARKDQPWDYDGKNILTSSTGQINQRAHTLGLWRYILDRQRHGELGPSDRHSNTESARSIPMVIDLNEIGVKNVWVPFKGHMNLGVGSGLANGINPNGFTVTGVNVQPGYYNSVEGQASDDVSWIQRIAPVGIRRILQPLRTSRRIPSRRQSNVYI